MVDLADLFGSSVTSDLRVGVATANGVDIGGAEVPALYMDPVAVAEGETVLCGLLGGSVGQRRVVVLGRLLDAVRPTQGTVTSTPVGSVISISAGGSTYEARFLDSYSPTVGDAVSISWVASSPVVLGKLGAVDPPPKPEEPDPTPDPDPTPTKPPKRPIVVTPKPPAKPVTGSLTVACTDSRTWSASSGGWSSYYGNDVMAGTWSGSTYRGYWFYGTKATSLKGRTITRLRLRIPGRKRVGNYNSSVTITLSRHVHSKRPNGEPSRSGSESITLPAGAGARTVDLPLEWADDIVNGGGIAVTSSGYVGLNGKSADAASGRLIIDWKK